ncbi:MAG: GTPase (G3E family) [Oscillospiraceae bacterium]|nr:GTPase (G3E family) [Oscillospiraceae bacterium]
MTKVDLITGILGSGKTTFLRLYAGYLLRSGQRIAILENDFGAVNVDMLLLQDLKSERCQLEMITGGGDPDCHKRRFKTQMIALGMQHFDRVLIEPSGIYDMDEFFDTLYEPPLDRWFEIDSILTVLDAGMDLPLSEQMEYLFASEAAHSGKLLLSKLTPEQLQAPQAAGAPVLDYLNAALTRIHCDRQFLPSDLIACDWSSLTDAQFQALSESGYRGASYVKRFSPEMIRSHVHYFMHIALPETRIRPILEGILHDPACGQIYRIKGSLPDGHGGWYKVNITQKQTELSPVPDGQAVLIIIGDDLHPERLDGHLHQENTDPEYVFI